MLNRLVMVMADTGTVLMAPSEPTVLDCSFSSFATLPHVTVGKPLHTKVIIIIIVIY